MTPACSYQPPKFTIIEGAFISALVAIVTAVINYPIDALFDVIGAPVADTGKVQAADTVLKKAGRRMSNAARRVSVAATDALVAAQTFAHSIAGGIEHRPSMAGDVTRELPESTLAAKRIALASMSVIGPFAQAMYAARASKRSTMNMASRSTRPSCYDENDDVVEEDDDDDDKYLSSDDEDDEAASSSSSSSEGSANGSDDDTRSRSRSRSARDPYDDSDNGDSSNHNNNNNNRGRSGEERERKSSMQRRLSALHRAASGWLAGVLGAVDSLATSTSRAAVEKEFQQLKNDIMHQRRFLPPDALDVYDDAWGLDPTGKCVDRRPVPFLYRKLLFLTPNKQ